MLCQRGFMFSLRPCSQHKWLSLTDVNMHFSIGASKPLDCFRLLPLFILPLFGNVSLTHCPVTFFFTCPRQTLWLQGKSPFSITQMHSRPTPPLGLWCLGSHCYAMLANIHKQSQTHTRGHQIDICYVVISSSQGKKELRTLLTTMIGSLLPPPLSPPSPLSLPFLYHSLLSLSQLSITLSRSIYRVHLH